MIIWGVNGTAEMEKSRMMEKNIETILVGFEMTEKVW